MRTPPSGGHRPGLSRLHIPRRPSDRSLLANWYRTALERLARLSALRSRFGARVILRSDTNQGYSPRAFERFLPWIERLDLEPVEQPLHPSEDAALLCAPPHLRRRLLADESVHTVVLRSEFMLAR